MKTIGSSKVARTFRGTKWINYASFKPKGSKTSYKSCSICVVTLNHSDIKNAIASE